jgi:hypothetical protein
MNKKILTIFVVLSLLAMLALPAFAVMPTETAITYFRKVETVLTYDSFWAGESHVLIIKDSTRLGSIYEGTDMSGPKLFDFTQYGSVQFNFKEGKHNWHFYHVWTSTIYPDSGFKGKFNGDSFNPTYGWYVVDGVLQGYGEFAGQKLVVQMARIPPNDALITGFLYS